MRKQHQESVARRKLGTVNKEKQKREMLAYTNLQQAQSNNLFGGGAPVNGMATNIPGIPQQMMLQNQ